MTMRLKGKKAFITGGSQGIGFAIAKEFVREGAKVVLIGRSIDKLKRAQKELGNDSFYLPADITKPTDLERAYRECKAKVGNLDILVANAGISEQTSLEDTTEEEFDRIISTNLKGVFFTVQRALSYLNQGSSIILISSLAAKQGVKHFSIYCASKAGVASLAQSFAAELLTKKIRVNSISPGVVRTPMLEATGLSEAAFQDWAKSIPMQRFAEPKEIASAALFLASDEGSYITATDIIVDGGVYGISPL